MVDQPQLKQSPWGGRKTLWRVLGGVLAGVLAIGALPAVAQAAEGEPNLATSNDNRTEVSFGDEIQYQAQISVPGGSSVKPGSVLTITFPEEVQLKAYDKTATAAMVRAPQIDMAKRTFTITWKELQAGALQSFPFVGTPSALTKADSTFQITATLVGETGAGEPFELSSVSESIVALGDWDAELVQPGGWKLPNKNAWSGQVGQTGNATASTMTKVVGMGDGSFADLRFRIDLTDPSATIPSVDWISNPYLRDNDLRTVLQRDADGIVVSHGSMTMKDIPSLQYVWGFRANIPGQEPGVYTAPIELYDVRADGTEVSVAKSTLELTLTPKTAATVDYLSKASRHEVVPGEAVSHRFATQYKIADELKDFAVTVPVPEGTTVESFNSARAANLMLAAKVEYSADGTTWTVLQPTNPAAWSFADVADRESIRWVRVTQTDRSQTFFEGQHSLNLRVKEDVAPGTELTMWVDSVTFFDPAEGEIVSAAPKDSTTVKTVAVAEHMGVPQIAAQTVLQNGRTNGFDAPYYNGSEIRQDLRLASYGSVALQDPYQFVVVPKGMSVESYTSATSPLGDGSWEGVIASTIGASSHLSGRYTVPFYSGAQVPTQADSIGSHTLTDGSTLYYWKATGVKLVGSGSEATLGGGELLLTDLKFKLNSVVSGNHQVIVGSGSSTDDTFEIAKRHNAFSEARLDDPASFGAYADQSAEALEVLRGIGISTNNALFQTKNFSVPGKDEISVSSAIQGSEDSEPITGNGVATSKIGSLVDYQINVTNQGTFSYEGFQFIDVFPFEDDTYTLSPGTPRGSAYDLKIVQRPVLKLNGRPVDALIQVSDSTTPPRFDAQGNAVASPDGSVWRDSAGGVADAKSLRVTLASGVVFRPGDTLSLDYVAQVPVDAKRGGVLANNSVAYKLHRPGFAAGLETSAGSVQVPAVTGDFELGGQMTDTSGVGLNGDVELHLYKLDESGVPKPHNGMVSQPGPTSSGNGYWGFVGLDPNETYLVKPVVTNDNYEIDPALLENGFLKYDYRGAASDKANRDVDVSAFNGKSAFELSDASGAVSQWLLDVNFATKVSTDITGDLIFVDKDGVALDGAATYLDGWTVELRDKQDKLVKSVKTTAEKGGAFEFIGQELFAGKHTLKIVRPDGTKFDFAPAGQPEEFDPVTGIYTQENLVPGTGIIGVHVRVTDPVAPKIIDGPTANSTWNPTSVSLASTDGETKVTHYVWAVTGPGDTTRSGTAARADSIKLPATPEDGDYVFTVQARDFAGNLSTPAKTEFKVDKTAPTLTASAEVVYDKGSPAHPTTAAKWVELFAAKADDGQGIGAKAVSVDTSKIDTSKIGTYDVTFSVSDELGNGATSFTSKYVVKYVTDPVVTLTTQDLTWEMGTEPLSAESAVEKFGATASVADGSTASPVSADISGIDWGTLGDYLVTFTVADSEGHTSEPVTATLHVVDTIAPQITTATDSLSWSSSEAQLGTEQEWIAAYTAAASDSGSGLRGLSVDFTKVNYNKAGTYPVTFTAKDNAGNSSTKSVSYTVAYAGDPTVKLEPEVFHELGDNKISGDGEWKKTFSLTSTAGEGATITSEKANAEAVDFTAEGSYPVVFTVTDSFGSKATATGTFTVRDTTPPTVKLDKPARKHAASQPDPVWSAADFAEFFGAKANDGKGTGVDADSWTVDGSIDWTTAGTYEVSLSVTDQAQSPNASESAVGTITIQAPPGVNDLTRKISEGTTHTIDPAKHLSSEGTLESLANGDLAVSGGGQAKMEDGKVVYSPAEGFVGIETVQVTVTDDLGQQSVWTITFDVRAKLALVDPEASNLWYETTVDGALTIAAADVLALVTGEQPALARATADNGFHGSLEMTDGGDIAFFTDQTDWFGGQSFLVSVVDEFGNELEITVGIGIHAVEMSVDNTEGYAGETEFTTELANLVPGKHYTLEFRSEPVTVAEFVADADGLATVTFTLPAGAAKGDHTLAAVNWNGHDRAVAKVTVLEDDQVVITPPAKPEQPSEISSTGGTLPIGLITAGVLTLFVGIALVLLRRRMRKESAH